MVKICPEHGLSDVNWCYCPTCGKRLWDITNDEFKKSWDFGYTKEGCIIKDGTTKWLKWLEKRHPEFKAQKYAMCKNCGWYMKGAKTT